MALTLTELIPLALIGLAQAQTSTVAVRPEFEVASIKPGDPNVHQIFTGMQRGGRFIATNASLKLLIGFAYDLRSYQISGGLNWLDSAQYTIEAKPDSGISVPSGSPGIAILRPMVQSLLADRFKLVVHRETKDGQVYNLVLAKDGSKLKAASEAKPGQRTGVGGRPGQLTGTSATISILARVLSDRLGRSVTDKTGLTGTYDFTLSWAPDPGQLNIGAPSGIPTDSPDTSGPSIFTAVQEQLGLKLESAKAPVEILIVDSAERPSEN